VVIWRRKKVRRFTYLLHFAKGQRSKVNECKNCVLKRLVYYCQVTRKLTGIFTTTVAPDKANEKQKQKKECNNAQQHDEPASTCNTLLNRFCSKTEMSRHINVKKTYQLQCRSRWCIFRLSVTVVQGLTSHRTHYRSFQKRVFCKGFPSLLQVKRPNHQLQAVLNASALINHQKVDEWHHFGYTNVRDTPHWLLINNVLNSNCVLVFNSLHPAIYPPCVSR